MTPIDRATALDVARIKADFPILKRQVHGKRLVYLDSARHVAEAASPCSTRWTATTASTTPTCTAACTRSPRRRPRRTRRARAKVAALLDAARPTRSSSRTQRHRGDQPRRVLVGARQPRRGRRHRAHADGAPRQHRAVAHARRRARRRAALDPAHRRLPPRPLRPRPRCSTAPSSSRSPRCRTCSAPSTTSARSPTPPTPPARTCSSTRARPSRTSPSTCRRGTPTSWRSPATRCSARPASAALWARAELLEAMPPFLGGGEMIRDVTVDGFTHQRGAVEVRGRHAADRRGHRASAPRSTTSTALGMDAVRAHEMALTGYALDALRRPLRRPPHDLRPARRRRCGAAPSRSCSRASTPTTSHRSSTRTASASGPATTAPSRSCGCWASRPPPGRRSTSTTTKPTSTPSSRRSARAEKFFAF